MNSFSLGKKTEVTWSQDNAPDHTSGCHPKCWLWSTLSPTVFAIRIRIANGWLEDQEQQFFYNGIRPLEKCWTKCILVAGEYVKKWQTMMVLQVCSQRDAIQIHIYLTSTFNHNHIACATTLHAFSAVMRRNKIIHYCKWHTHTHTHTHTTKKSWPYTDYLICK